jgi:predicted RNA-binding protein with PUA domain
VKQVYRSYDEIVSLGEVRGKIKFGREDQMKWSFMRIAAGSRRLVQETQKSAQPFQNFWQRICKMSFVILFSVVDAVEFGRRSILQRQAV